MTNTATKLRTPLRRVVRRIHRVQRDYAGGQDRPLGGYSVIIGAYTAVLGISGGLTAGLVLAPRATRLVLTALTAVAGSDAIQLVYDRAKPES